MKLRCDLKLSLKCLICFKTVQSSLISLHIGRLMNKYDNLYLHDYVNNFRSFRFLKKKIDYFLHIKFMYLTSFRKTNQNVRKHSNFQQRKFFCL